MGILNLTSDSFFDPGKYLDPSSALEQATRLISEGADILDIGAESSKPGSHPIPEDLEKARIVSFLSLFRQSTPMRNPNEKYEVNIPISIDTSRSSVAKVALEMGASMINDIYALRRDPELVSVISDFESCRVVLMHMQGTPTCMQKSPHYENVVDETLAFLEERASFAKTHGIREENIIVDPGIGFGKTPQHNCALLKNIARFRSLGFPVLVGVSRKSFLGAITGKNVEDRLLHTAATIVYLALQSIDVLRVHDVSAMKEVLAVIQAIDTGQFYGI
jgi:dihydropteroate synthase